MKTGRYYDIYTKRFENTKPLKETVKMRNPKRIPKILKLIEKIWQANSDLRLCQLLENCNIVSETKSHCMYYVEDEDLEIRLKEFYHEN